MSETWDSEVEETLEEYQRELRERASNSIEQLKHALEKENSKSNRIANEPKQSSSSLGDHGHGFELAIEDLKHSHAVNQLAALLQEHGQGKQTSSPRRITSPSKKLTAGEESLAAINDLVPIIHDQSQYIHHLEAEVKFCKDELSGMKQRMSVVVLENDELHSQLKSVMMQNIMREQTLLEASAASENSGIISKNESRIKPQIFPEHDDSQQLPYASATKNERLNWQQELEKVRLLYQAQTETLEYQVRLLRKDLSDSQKNCEEFQRQLRQQEVLIASRNSSRVGGLCVQCAQHEAVLAHTHANVHNKAIERLTREKENLMETIVSMRKDLTDLQQRESKAYEEVKHALEMTEEAKLEKTKVLFSYDQLKMELERKSARLEKAFVARTEKISAEKEAIKGEAKKEREELNAKIMSLTQNVTMLEGQLEKLTRENKSLVIHVEESQKMLSQQEIENTKVCGEIRYQLNETKMKKDEAEKEHREYRIKTIKHLEIKDQEIEKLALQLNEKKQRLELAQQDAARANDECLKLTELLRNAEHQLHLARLEKEDIQNSLSSEIRSVAFQAEQCEQELKQKIQQMEAQHERTVMEMDSLVTSQNNLIIKFKNECHALAAHLEHLTEKNRSEINQLIQEKLYMHNKCEKQQKRIDELEVQCTNHGKMHERMKTRLQQLDKHCQNSAQQIVELLSKQNELMKERQILTQEIQFLKKTGTIY